MFQVISNYLRISLVISRILCTFVPAEEHLYLSMELCNQNAQSSQLKVQSIGRSELAQRYFPYVQPMSAWLKLKALLMENPDLEPLTQLKRRTFSPAEVNKIYQLLGQP